ncbi:transposase [Spartinivicinus poritis]|uniref:transposase n=1 Tax=Spartinivicinus poritis TaxID=2994640 RepID=UPI003CC91A94
MEKSLLKNCWVLLDHYRLVIVDQAAWHTTHHLEIPVNIMLLNLPPVSPELNPVERIWENLEKIHWQTVVLKISMILLSLVVRHGMYL